MKRYTPLRRTWDGTSNSHGVSSLSLNWLYCWSTGLCTPVRASAWLRNVRKYRSSSTFELYTNRWQPIQRFNTADCSLFGYALNLTPLAISYILMMYLIASKVKLRFFLYD